MKNSDPRNWEVEYQCPQCGSPVTLPEADRILTCPYCRVRLFIAPNDFLRFYMTPARPQDGLVYVPYWRMKGTLYSCVQYEVTNRLVDSTQIASDVKGMPPTLGLRPGVMPLKPVSPEMEGDFLKPDMPFEEGVAKMEKALSAASDMFVEGHAEEPEKKRPAYFKAYVGEARSLIYAPVYVKDARLFDAVLDSPVASAQAENPARINACGVRASLAGATPSFIPAICPECGGDLSGDAKTIVLVCPVCFSGWGPSAPTLKAVPLAAVPYKPDNTERPVYLPFWRMKIRFKNLRMENYKDFAIEANLPKAIKEEWKDRPCPFWAPAFKIHPPVFLRLSRDLTVFQPETDMDERPEIKTIYPITLPLSEAVESVKVNLAFTFAAKKRLYPLLGSIETTLEDALLVCVPFLKRGEELFQPHMNFCITSAAARTGVNL